MKFLKLIFVPILLSLIFACAGDDSEFLVNEEESEIGAIPRLIKIISSNFDLAQASTTAYSHEVEFVTQDDGANVDTYEVYVEFQDNTLFNGFNSTAEVLLKTYGQSDFGTSTLGKKNITINLPFTEVSNTLSLDPNLVAAGDIFRFSSRILLNNGRIFDSVNTPITNAANPLGLYFDWVVDISCPVNSELFTGMYQITYQLDGSPSVGPAYRNGEIVEVVAIGNGSNLRSFDASLLPDLGSFSASTIFDIECNRLIYISADTGVDCNGDSSDNSIGFGPALNADGNIVSDPLDLNDDSEIVLYLNEGFKPGNCAIDQTESKLTLTKM